MSSLSRRRREDAGRARVFSAGVVVQVNQLLELEPPSFEFELPPFELDLGPFEFDLQPFDLTQ